MTLTDIIALAKEGYKPSDIKELIELAKTSEEAPSEEAKQETTEEEPPKVEAEPTPEEETSDIDYKKLYEDEKAKTEHLQGLFAHKDLGTKEVDNESVFADVMRNFM